VSHHFLYASYGLFLLLFRAQTNDPHRQLTTPFHLQCYPRLLRNCGIPLVYSSSLGGNRNLSSHWGPLYNPFGYYLTTIDCRTSTSGRTLIGCEYHWIVKRVGPQTAIPSLVPYSSPSILNSEEHWITLLLQFYFKELIRTTSDLFYKYKVTISNHQICERYFYTFFS